MVSGAVLSASGLIAASFAPSVMVLFATVPFMTGLGCSLAYAGSVLSIAQYFKKKYTLYNGIVSAGSGVGMILWPLFIQILIDHFAWSGALMMMAGIQFHIVPLALMLTFQRSGVQSDDLPHKNWSTEMTAHHPVTEGIQDGSSIGGDSEENEKVVSGRQHTKYTKYTNMRNVLHDNSACVEIELKDVYIGDENEVGSPHVQDGLGITAHSCCTSCLESTGLSLAWQNRVFCAYLPIALMGGCIYGTFLAHIVAAAAMKGIPPIEAAFLISVIGITNVISRATHGLLLENGIVHQMMLFAFSYFIAAISVLVLPSTTSYALMIVCAAGVGVGSGMYIPLHLVHCRHMVPMHRFPGAVGMTLFFVCIGIMMSAIISGYIFDETGDYQLAFSFAGVMGLLAGCSVVIEHILWNYCIIDSRWPPRVNSHEKPTKNN